MKPAPVFLNIEEVDDSHDRASWYTWEGTEVYRGKPGTTAKEAVRVARAWFEAKNKDKVRYIDETTAPRSSHAKRGDRSHVTRKKTDEQLDREIAEVLAGRSPSEAVKIAQAAEDARLRERRKR